ncbi:subtilisin family serine protease [Lewinella aquimaris]|uniref:Subtilisin family serine protease n=1 Tax=Neolewinella aquimaris TaxID=1835722 RepID=A0A840E3T4_9BACT|nr:S8 family serine peptidase [Neolewinella aquimaris]MBB4078402.1 subtilisin family serine protease [Neolewinella aquimaris]
MSTINVRTSNGNLNLRKSEALVGLKISGEEKPPEVREEVMPELGGFEVVALDPGRNIDRALDQVRQSEGVSVGTHVYFAENDNRPVVPTGLIYCTPVENADRNEVRLIFQRLNLTIEEDRPDGTILLSVTRRSRNPLKVAAALQELPIIETAIPDLDVPLDQYFSEPRDGLFPEEWHLENEGSIPGVPNYPLKRGADARVRAAWKRLNSLGSSAVTIAVIDKGFDLNHPDLAGKSVHPLHINSNETKLPVGAAAGTHGTPCASVALGAANGTGIVGAAPNARLMPLHGLTYSPYYTERMFNHCVTSGADVISCSWGTVEAIYRPGALHERAVTSALTRGRGGKGCIVVFAAGNEGKNLINYYAQLPGVIAVGASTSNDTHASYSNRGPGLTVVAPSDGGWPILAARASWDPGVPRVSPEKKYYADGRDRGPYHKHFGGTSCATPLVAGICALMLSANPELTSAEVKAILQRTADKIGTPSDYDAGGYSDRYGYGRVNADRAVAEALRYRGNGNAPAPPPIAVTLPQAGTYSLQVSALSNHAAVADLSAKLQSEFNLPVAISPVETNGSTVYRVLVGQFATAELARDNIDRLRAAGYRPFVRELTGIG